MDVIFVVASFSTAFFLSSPLHNDGDGDGNDDGDDDDDYSDAESEKDGIGNDDNDDDERNYHHHHGGGGGDRVAHASDCEMIGITVGTASCATLDSTFVAVDPLSSHCSFPKPTTVTRPPTMTTTTTKTTPESDHRSKFIPHTYRYFRSHNRRKKRFFFGRNNRRRRMWPWRRLRLRLRLRRQSLVVFRLSVLVSLLLLSLCVLEAAPPSWLVVLINDGVAGGNVGGGGGVNDGSALALPAVGLGEPYDAPLPLPPPQPSRRAALENTFFDGVPPSPPWNGGAGGGGIFDYRIRATSAYRFLLWADCVLVAFAAPALAGGAVASRLFPPPSRRYMRYSPPSPPPPSVSTFTSLHAAFSSSSSHRGGDDGRAATILRIVINVAAAASVAVVTSVAAGSIQTIRSIKVAFVAVVARVVGRHRGRPGDCTVLPRTASGLAPSCPVDLERGGNNSGNGDAKGIGDARISALSPSSSPPSPSPSSPSPSPSPTARRRAVGPTRSPFRRPTCTDLARLATTATTTTLATAATLMPRPNRFPCVAPTRAYLVGSALGVASSVSILRYVGSFVCATMGGGDTTGMAGTAAAAAAAAAASATRTVASAGWYGTTLALALHIHRRLLIELVSRICALGVLLSQVLNGFGCVSLPYSCLSGLYLEPIDARTIADATDMHKRLWTDVDAKKQALAELKAHSDNELPVMAPPTALPFDLRRRCLSSGPNRPPPSDALESLRKEIEFAETMCEELADDIDFMKDLRRLADAARSPLGRVRGWIGIIFSIVLLVRVALAAMGLMRSPDNNSTTMSPHDIRTHDDNVDPITLVLLWLVKTNLLKREKEDLRAASQCASLALAAFLSATQVRTFLRLASTLSRRVRPWIVCGRDGGNGSGGGGGGGGGGGSSSSSSGSSGASGEGREGIGDAIASPSTSSSSSSSLWREIARDMGTYLASFVLGCYFMACVALTKLTLLPPEHRLAFSAALLGKETGVTNNNVDWFALDVRATDGAFVTSAIVSALVLASILGLRRRNSMMAHGAYACVKPLEGVVEGV